MANNTLAYRSSISVSNIKRSVSSLGKGIKRAQGSANSISQSISRRNETKRQAISVTAGLFQKRQEAVRRREQEDIVEASGTFGAVRRTRKVIMNSTKGFLGRILDYVGTLLVGWALINLPTIIKLGEQLIGRIQKLTKVLSTFITDTTQFLFGFGQLLDGVARNLISFDFADSQGRITKAMEQMRSSFSRMEDSIFDAIKILSEPIDFQTEREEEKPTTEPGLPPPVGTTTGGGSDFWTLVAVASREDSDPQGQADVAQSIYNRAASGAYGSNSIRGVILSSGQYQPTWDYPRKNSSRNPNVEWYSITDAESAARATGFSVGAIQSVANSLLNKDLQRKAAEFVQGRTDFKGAYVGSFPSIQRKKGDNWFGWEYGYTGKTTAGIPDFKTTTATPSKIPRTGNIPIGTDLTNVIGRGVRYIEITSGFGSRGGNHRGLDIAAPAGTYISLRLDSEVVFAGWENPNDHGKGYGQVIDLWVPELGVQLRFGHCAGFLVTGGKVKAGRSFATVGSTGRSSGPHIHFEYTKQRDKSSGGSDGDPSAYVPYILLTNKPNYSPFTVPGKGIVSPAAAQLTIEQNKDVSTLRRERKDNVIAVPLPQQSRNKPVMLPVGKQDINISTDDSLNRFVTQKLLLDLAYT